MFHNLSNVYVDSNVVGHETVRISNKLHRYLLEFVSKKKAE